MIDVSELMDDPDFSTDYQIVRAGVGGYVNEGEWSPGVPSTINRFSPVQPTKPEDMIEYLPEGERDSGAITVWSREELILREADSDIILYNGNSYRVAHQRPWLRNGYWQVIAVQFNP